MAAIRTCCPPLTLLALPQSKRKRKPPSTLPCMVEMAASSAVGNLDMCNCAVVGKVVLCFVCLLARWYVIVRDAPSIVAR
jgi:hypothetical protein